MHKCALVVCSPGVVCISALSHRPSPSAWVNTAGPRVAERRSAITVVHLSWENGVLCQKSWWHAHMSVHRGRREEPGRAELAPHRLWRTNYTWLADSSHAYLLPEFSPYARKQPTPPPRDIEETVLQSQTTIINLSPKNYTDLNEYLIDRTKYSSTSKISSWVKYKKLVYWPWQRY